MIDRDAEIERAARAMCDVDGSQHPDDWIDYKPHATAAITPLLDRIEALEAEIAVYPYVPSKE